MMKISNEDYYKYLIKFGFGITTSSDLSNERAGVLSHYNSWSGLSKFSMAIGQEVTVNALQMLNSLLVVPNGGYLLKPVFVKEIRDESDQVIQKIKFPNIIRPVISSETAEKVKHYLISVVENGTGGQAKINGIKIGGKTGTAQLLDPKTGKYSKELSAASFFGFFPAEDPTIAMIVIVNQAKKRISGGSTAAPLFKKIALRILEYQGNRYPTENIKSNIFVKDNNKSESKNSANVKNIEKTFAVSSTEETKNITDVLNSNKMPNLISKSKRECLTILSSKIKELDIELKIEGNGYLYFQNIKPSDEIKHGEELALKFK